MAITVKFQTSPAPDVRVTHINLYRKLPTETLFVRIVQLPISATEYTDLSGVVSAQYYYTWFDNVRLLESTSSPTIIALDNLDVVTITGYALGLDGLPTGKDVEVSATLQNLQTSMPVYAGTLITNLRQTAITDSAGLFVFAVLPNDLIYPGGTHYKINYLDRSFYKVVKSTDGPGQLLASLVDVNPKELR